MKIYCPDCQKIFVPDESSAGKAEAYCPVCGRTVALPDHSPAPGCVIGDFLIEKELSKGGMGEVYLARQLSLDRPVALKVLQQKFLNDKEYVESLFREARAAGRISHPHIVQAYAVGEDEGTVYFAMEFIRGETLKVMLKREKKLEFGKAAEIIREVASALDAAWREEKLVHQDIKPDNIMLDANGFAKLADLGLAKTSRDKEEVIGDEVLGTPQYISPEQLLGIPTDVRSDIYSLGATFYHLVTGRFAYVGKDGDEIARQHVEGTLTPPREINPELPDALNAIIMKMMAKEAKDRYQTPDVLVKALDVFLRNYKREKKDTSVPKLAVPVKGSAKKNKKVPAPPPPPKIPVVTPLPAKPEKVTAPAEKTPEDKPPKTETPPEPVKTEDPPRTAETSAPEEVKKSDDPEKKDAAEAKADSEKKDETSAPEAAPKAADPEKKDDAAEAESDPEKKAETSVPDADGNGEPPPSPDGNPSWSRRRLVIIIIIAVAAAILFLAGGGTGAYFAGRSVGFLKPYTAWIDSGIAKIADLRKKAPAQDPAPAPVVHEKKVPPKTVRKVVPVIRTRPDFMAVAHQLLTAKQRDLSFLQACDRFFARYPKRLTKEEEQEYRKVRLLFAAQDELLRVAPAREALRIPAEQKLAERRAAAEQHRQQEEQRDREEQERRAAETQKQQEAAAQDQARLAETRRLAADRKAVVMRDLVQIRKKILELIIPAAISGNRVELEKALQDAQDYRMPPGYAFAEENQVTDQFRAFLRQVTPAEQQLEDYAQALAQVEKDGNFSMMYKRKVIRIVKVTPQEITAKDSGGNVLMPKFSLREQRDFYQKLDKKIKKGPSAFYYPLLNKGFSQDLVKPAPKGFWQDALKLYFSR